MHTKKLKKKARHACWTTHGLLALLLAWLACPILPPFYKTDHGTNHQTTGEGHSLVAHTLRPFHFSTWNVLSVPGLGGSRVLPRRAPGPPPATVVRDCSPVAAGRRWRSRDGRAVAVRVPHCRAEGVVRV